MLLAGFSNKLPTCYLVPETISLGPQIYIRANLRIREQLLVLQLCAVSLQLTANIRFWTSQQICRITYIYSSAINWLFHLILYLAACPSLSVGIWICQKRTYLLEQSHLKGYFSIIIGSLLTERAMDGSRFGERFSEFTRIRKVVLRLAAHNNCSMSYRALPCRWVQHANNFQKLKKTQVEKMQNNLAGRLPITYKLGK